MMRQKTYTFRSPAQLFWHRLMAHFREMIGIFNSVVDDWTVWLYILIPGALISGRYYVVWLHELPQWSLDLPLTLFPAIIGLLIVVSGSMVTLVHEADVLFILQKKKWIQALILRGSLYSMATLILKVIVYVAIMLPFLAQCLDMDMSNIWCYLVFSITFAWLLSWLKHIVRIRTKGWRRYLWIIPCTWLPLAAYVRLSVLWHHESMTLVGSALIMAILSGILLFIRLRMRGTFMSEIEEDLVQRTKLTNLVLSQVVDKPRPTRSKPLLMRRSQYIFRSREPMKRLAGAAVKSLLRQPGQLLLYLQFMGICVITLIALPPTIQWVALLGMVALLAYSLFLHWLRFIGNEFISLLPWSEEETPRAGVYTVRLLLMPFAVIGSATWLCSLLSLWMALILIVPCAILLTWLGVHFISLIVNRQT